MVAFRNEIRNNPDTGLHPTQVKVCTSISIPHIK